MPRRTRTPPAPQAREAQLCCNIRRRLGSRASRFGHIAHPCGLKSMRASGVWPVKLARGRRNGGARSKATRLCRTEHLRASLPVHWRPPGTAHEATRGTHCRPRDVLVGERSSPTQRQRHAAHLVMRQVTGERHTLLLAATDRHTLRASEDALAPLATKRDHPDPTCPPRIFDFCRRDLRAAACPPHRRALLRGKVGVEVGEGRPDAAQGLGGDLAAGRGKQLPTHAQHETP